MRLSQIIAEKKNCPGCKRPFPSGEPYPDVENCETCERFGTPKDIKESVVPLNTILNDLRPKLALAAQSVYDEWEQVEGLDEIYGGGGVCDAISNAMAEVLALENIDYTEGGQEGDDHAYLIAYDSASAYAVDIPPSVYEAGGGMSWQKIPDVQIQPEDILIAETWRPDWIDEDEYA